MATVSSTPPTQVTPVSARVLDVVFDDKLRFTREHYHELTRLGLIESDTPVELLNGEIVPMSPVGPLHASVTRKLNDFFALRLAGRYLCSGPNPQATGNHSEPEPDYQVLVRRDDYYAQRHPAPEDVKLAIEVADSSLAKDTGPKMRIYAAAGIVEYWVVDLVNRQLLVHTEPDKEAALYKSVVTHDDKATVAPGVAGDCGLELAWLIGPKGAPKPEA